MNKIFVIFLTLNAQTGEVVDGAAYLSNFKDIGECQQYVMDNWAPNKTRVVDGIPLVLDVRCAMETQTL